MSGSSVKPIIELIKIHKQFPGVYALKDISLDIKPGEVHALMGENGAGKSTLIKIMSGAYMPDSGSYLIDGREANINSTYDAIEKGISVIYQELNVASNLSIAENVYYGCLPVNKFGKVDWNKLYAQTQIYLDEIGLAESPKMKVGYLSVAKQQMVEIAKSLSKRPRVIIMDEPTSALSPKEIDNLFSVINRLRKKGTGILYVSHKLDEIFTIADRVTVMRDGEYVGTERTENLNTDKLISMMVGRNLCDMYPKTQSKIGDKVLEVNGLTTEYVKDITFHVRKGEIVGFSGLMGAGRTELARALFGADERLNGEIRIDGKRIPPDSTRSAVKCGLGMVPESRKDEGIFPNLCVRKNMTISTIRQFTKLASVKGELEQKRVETMIGDLKVKTPGLHQLIVNLSGGNQQKVIVARWLLKDDLKVLIIDEPTRGIDVGAKAEIYGILDRLAQAGLAIIMMSSEMCEILSMCDRVYVMKNGKITGEFGREEATQEALLCCAIGTTPETAKL